MSRGILAKKLGMTQLFDESGKAVPVTVLRVGPNKILQVKTAAKDKYDAIQVGFEKAREITLSKAEIGHCKKTGTEFYKNLAEFRNPGEGFEAGQELNVDIFEVGQEVKITGVSKGKGFQGAIKRHGFKGGRATHGSKFHRAPGSMGSGTYPGKVMKGKKMPGHTGMKEVSIHNVKVVSIDKENNILMLKGGVPGARTSVIRIEA